MALLFKTKGYFTWKMFDNKLGLGSSHHNLSEFIQQLSTPLFFVFQYTKASLGLLLLKESLLRLVCANNRYIDRSVGR